ncbi:MAG: hypothetical protein MR867_01780 [Eubacterium sp.]|nr:hypothetical protein [Eubacterium sp.]MDD7209061.1 hypothetical protein [Lachnospiraceae bacterium]MDY5496425.1 hypothetical protein [Anaerobutyricum sp.]
MAVKLEDRCRELIDERQYKVCEKEICEAMARCPHSPVPHNLMGILLEKEQDHILAMKHFRAAYSLDPTYIPARFNMEQYGEVFSTGKCAFKEEDCPVKEDDPFKIIYDEHHVGHIVRK